MKRTKKLSNFHTRLTSKEVKIMLGNLPFKRPFLEKWKEWLEYRNKIKHPYKTMYGINGTLNKIRKYSNQSEKLAILILERSMENEWIGIFKPTEEMLIITRPEWAIGNAVG